MKWTKRVIAILTWPAKAILAFLLGLFFLILFSIFEDSQPEEGYE